MGLYDRYQLSNSSQIPQYQGSAVPELVNVSQELQRRYDTVQDTNDYMSRFLNSLQALPQDQGPFKQWSQGYKGKVAQIAQRPDLENAVRETTMLARNLPDEYSGFGQRVKDFSDRQAQLDKDVTDGKLTPESAQLLLQRDVKNDQGIQLDPNTGRYTGRFSGQNYVHDLNPNNKVDKWMKDVFPTTQGYSVENIGGQWMVKQGGKTVTLGMEDIKDKSGNVVYPGIRRIIQSGAAGDTEFQAWMHQQQDLGTFNQDYSKVDPSQVSDKSIIQPLLDKGYSMPEAMKAYQQSQIGSDIMNRAYNYGNKYIRNDSEQSVDYSANPYGLAEFEHQNRLTEKDAKDSAPALQLASTMTLGGADVQSAGDFGKVQQGVVDEHKQAMKLYGDWVKDKVRKQDGTVWKKEDGKWIDVTKDAQSLRDNIKYIDEKKQQLEAVDNAAKNASGFTVTDEDKKRAQAAYDSVMAQNEVTQPILGGSSLGMLSTLSSSDEADKKKAAQEVYDRELRDNPRYKAYEQELQKRMTGTTTGTDLFAFTNEKTVDALSSQIENLVSGLGLEKGMIPVQIGSGANKGQQLSAADWDQLKGKVKVIGTTITGDASSPIGLVARAFKNVKGKKTEGEDMIIRLPNTNIAGIAQNNMDKMQYYYMQKSSGLAQVLNNPTRSTTQGDITIKANTDDPRGGWTVRKGRTEQTLYSLKDIIDFLDQQK